MLRPLLVLLLCSCGRIDFELTRTDTVTDMAAYLALGVQTEPSEDCLSLHSDGLMYLHTCGDSDRTLCEYDGIAAVPSAY